MQPTHLSPALADAIARSIDDAEGGRFRLRDTMSVAGGSISRNVCVTDGKRRYFVKIATAAGERFAAEVDGLAALARCEAIAVPRRVACGRSQDSDFLVLGWLDLSVSGDDARLGEALATLHESSGPEYGWSRDNFIGATPQANAWSSDWPTFFADCRLRPQLALAARAGAAHLAAQAEPLLTDLPGLLGRPTPRPALVHGDLWRGNVAFSDGRPALFDPAVHLGDAETDLAMASLFGGFSPEFFAAYRAIHPARPEHAARHELYRLYHVLNHFNLFGGAYANQAEALIRQLLRAR